MAGPPGAALVRAADRIDALMAWLGRVVALLGYATVLICFISVYLRYVLGVGFTWLQESYVWSHAIVILLGSGYCLLKGGFVRVDMLYAKASARTQAWIDLIGTVVFTAPFLFMVAWYGWPFFQASWSMKERSAYEDGLGGLYWLKGMLMVFAVIVAVQALSVVLRNAAVIRGAEPRKAEGGHP